MYMLKVASISVAALAMAVGSASAADEAKVELSAIPQKVTDTAMKEVSGFKATSANTETESGKKVYELQALRAARRLKLT